MPTATKRLLTFLIGPIMVTALTAVSLAIVMSSSPARFPEIQYACSVVGIADPVCLSEASVAGILTIVAFLLVIAVAVWASRRFDIDAVAAFPLSPLLTKIFLAFGFALIIVHLLERGLGPAYSSHMDELYHFSNFISLETLLWPFLIQLLLIEQDFRLRGAIISLLLLITILTPFRTAALTIFVFAFALPLVLSIGDAYRAAWRRNTLIPIASRAALVSIAACTFLLSGAVDTQTRALSAAPQFQGKPIRDAELPAEMTTLQRVQQRLAYPLYQAGLVARVSESTSLPSVIDEFGRKFRLSDKPNLNEFLYKQIYPSARTLGQTDTLYYGEGAAYFGKAGIIWALCAPISFVVAWLWLRRAAVEVGAILSIQLWRSSFAGLVTMLPAVLLQVAGMAVMSRFGRFAAAPLFNTHIPRFANGFLVVSVLAAAAALGWTTVDEPQRRDLLRLELVAPSGCTFEVTTIPSLPHRVDEAVTIPGRAFRSEVTSYTPERVYLVVPYGKVLKQHLSDLVASVSFFTVCDATKNSSGAQIRATTMVSGRGILPLNLLALAAAMIAAILLAGMPVEGLFASLFARRDLRV